MAVAEDEAVQFKLRIIPRLKERITAAAATAGRSVNREAVCRLESSLDQTDKLGVYGNALLEQFAQVLAAAKGAAGSAWPEDRTAWDLVRSTIDRLIDGWEHGEEEEDLSPEAAEAYGKWRSSMTFEGRSRDQIEAEFKELELRKDVIGLSADEATRFERIRTVLNAKPSFEQLKPGDRLAVKRRIGSDRLRTEFWSRVASLFAGPPGHEKNQPRRKEW